MGRLLILTVVVFLAVPSLSCIKSVEVPKEVAYVEANRERFIQPQDHPLLDLPAGATADDLAGLDGCWGHVVGSDVVGGPSETWDIKARKFNLAEGRYTSQFLERRLFGLDGVYEYVFSAEIADPAGIVVQPLSGWADWFDRGPVSWGPGDAEPEYREVILQGDALRMGTSYGGVPAIYYRFDCPD